MSSVPPLAGISNYAAATRADLSVNETVAALRRLARVERRTMLMLAAHLSAVPEWEVKCALALHLWQDAEHCGWLRERVSEMRKPPHFLDRADDPALEAFFDELVRSRSTRELLTGVYLVLKPSLIDAIDEHCRRANPLADHPTLRLLRFLRLEEREQVDWGRGGAFRPRGSRSRVGTSPARVPSGSGRSRRRREARGCRAPIPSLRGASRARSPTPP